MKKSKNNVQKKKWPFSKLTTIILSAILAFIVLSVVGIIALNIYNWKPTVAFYGLSSQTQNGIIEVLQSTKTRRRGNRNVWSYNVEVLDTTVSLEKALKKDATFVYETRNSKGERTTEVKKARKPELIFTYRGKNAESVALNSKITKASFENEILNGMTTSIQGTAILNSKNKIVGVPILIDNCELAVNLSSVNSFWKSKYKTTNIQNFVSIQELEQFLLREKKSNRDLMSSLVLDFNNSYNFLNTFGALVEAVSGSSVLKSASQKIWNISKSSVVGYTSYYNLLKELTQEGGEFYETIQVLNRFQKEGLFDKNIKQFSSKDAKAFMQSSLSSAGFLTLSEHRTYDQKAISKYLALYYPSQNQERVFSSPVVMAIPCSKNKSVLQSVKMLSNEKQSELCIKAKLAPVNATCGTIDVQGSDVRYWVAASSVPFEGLAESAFKTLNSRNQFADALKSFIN